MTKLNGTAEIDENLLLFSSNFIKQREYWEKKLSGEITGTYLLSEVKRKTPTRETNGKIDIIFPAAVCDRLIKLSKKSDISIYIILLAALKILIYRYGNNDNEDIIILSPVYTANVSEETVNDWVMVRDQVKPTMIVKEFILEMRQSVLEAYENQDYPVEKLINDLLPLFASKFIEGNQRFITNVVSIFKNIHTHHPGEQETGDRLIFIFERIKADKLHGNIRYNAGIYDDHYIRQAAGHFLKILEQIIFQIETRMTEISLLSKQEQKQLLEDFNGEKTAYPSDKSIHELFAHQAGKVPDRTALVVKNEGWKGRRVEGKKEEMHLTYRELDEKSNQLAWLLKAKGVQTSTIVGIMLKRSIEMVLGIVAILKTGSAYLPIDWDYPLERIRYMLIESDCNHLLTIESHGCWLENVAKIIHIESEEIGSENTANLLPVGNSRDPAYVIYTSGTTGRPKGVIVEHRSVARLVKNTNYIDFCSQHRLLQTGALEFDASTFEIWGTLLNGASLVLVNKETLLNAEKLKEVIKKYAISIIWMTSALFNQVSHLELFVGLQYLLVGGDVLSPPHINRVRKAFPHLKVLNGYGPTENTTFSTTYLICDQDKESNEKIPIGRPISNSTAYIVDRNNQLMPVGVTGELVVGGDGVSRGYINNPELTSEKFIKSPFPGGQKSNLNVERLYKTGDLACWRQDGNIDFLGRMDFQVKIRGHRVELGEIESRLLTIDFIKEAVVIDRELPSKDQEDFPDRHLCAYVVTHENAPVSQLPDILSQHLPHYMIPSYFTKIDRIPLTANGKVNRKLLPEPEIKIFNNYIPPGNHIEKKLVKIWSEVLARDEEHSSQLQALIGVNDSFFRWGGHSLKATAVVSKIHKLFNVKLILGDIFSHSTVRGLAQKISGLVENKYKPITPVEKKEYYLLSSAQKRLYIQQQMKPGNVNYNLPIYISLEGKLERARLEAVFQQLVRRHESLRTSFEVVGDEAVQRIHDKVAFKIEYYNKKKVEVEEERSSRLEGTRGLAPLSHAPLPLEPATRNPQPATALISSFIRPFDLSQVPLLRVGLLHTPPCEHPSQEGNFEDKHILMIDMHHIITDGTSLGILSREFMQLYDGKTPAGLNVQYKDFSEWQQRLFKTKEIENQENYWLNQFEKDIPVLDLPTDYPRSDTRNFEGEYVLSRIPGELTTAINQLELQTETTLHIVLLAVSTILFSKYSGQEDIVVGTGIAGRHHPELENVMGLFINMLGMRNHPSENKTFIQFLLEVKENALNAYANQAYQFETLVQKLNLQGNPSRNPLFDVVFQTQNIEIPVIEVQGLTFKPYEKDFQVSHFDLVIYCDEEAQNESINLRLLYSPVLFKRSTIEEMANHFVEILMQVLENREMKLKDIKISMEVAAARSKLHQEKVRFQF